MDWDLFTSAEAARRADAEDRPERVEAGGTAVEPPVFTVAEVAAAAHAALGRELGTLLVRGEVTSWRRHASGHCYFALRDESAQIRCVMFRTDAARMPIDPDNGMDVRVLAEPGLYEARGEFQLIVRALEAIGEDGLWRLAFERLRARLAEDGLLDPRRKRAIPNCPAVVGVVTSGEGAALRDILNVVGRRAPWTRIVFRHARVQGEGASIDIADAIRFICRHARPDVLIVGRGGGSIQDLWAFNEEPVARAIAACPVPVISAVGHEIDYTIADLVADLRAPTPSAAAEHVVPDAADLARRLEGHRRKLGLALRRHVERRSQRLDRFARELEIRTRTRLRDRRERMGAAAARLHALSPLAALARGFAVPLDGAGRVLRGADQFRAGSTVRLRVVDGEVDLRVEGARRSVGPAEAGS